MDNSGNGYVTGYASKPLAFPTSATDPKITSYDPTYNGDDGFGGDAFITKISLSSLSFTLTSQDFGLIPPGTTADRTFTIKNIRKVRLTGTVTTTAPFSVIAGGSFSLAAGASQDITVRFAPTKAGLYPRTLKASGNFNTITAPLKGIAGSPAQRPPRLTTSLLKGVPGDAVVLSGRFFGPQPGQLTLDGNPITTLTWTDDDLRFIIPTLDPGNHTVTVANGYGQASATLQIFTNQPTITALRPTKAAPGATVIVDGYNFGPQQNASTLTFGGLAVSVLSWSDQRIAFKVPNLKTGKTYPLRLIAPTGTTEKSMWVLNFELVPTYGDCDKGFIAYGICPPITLAVTRQNGNIVNIQVENLVDRWYELNITPTNITLPDGLPSFIGPKQKFTLTGITVTPGANIQFFANATSDKGMLVMAFDLLHIIATGDHVSLEAAGLAVTALSVQGASPALVDFFANLVNNLLKGDYYEIVGQIRSLPRLATDPTVQYFLMAYLGLSPEQITKFGNLGSVVHVGGVVIKMLEQLALPRYAAASLSVN